MFRILYVYLYDVQRNLKQCTVSAISKMGVFPVGSDFYQAPGAFSLDPSTYQRWHKKWPRDINIYTFYMIAFFLYKYLPVNVITVNLLEDQKTTEWLKNIEKNNYLSL